MLSCVLLCIKPPTRWPVSVVLVQQNPFSVWNALFLSLICAESNNKEDPDGKDHKSRVLFSAIDDSELFTDKMELYEDEKSKSVNTVLHRYTHSGSIQKSSGQEPKVG